MSKMSKLFDQDNMFFAIMGVLFDLIILNVLTLLCCLPVVTAGASFTAMHSVLWRMVRHEETYVARQFFDSFKRNLKQSLLPWLAFHGVDARAADGVRRVHGIGDYCDCAVLLPAAFSL